MRGRLDPGLHHSHVAYAVQVIADAKAVLHEALVTLNHHNETIAVDDEDVRCKASKVVGDATEAVARIVERLNALESQTERQLKRPGSLSGVEGARES